MCMRECEVLVVNDERLAVEAALQFDPDLILLDVVMPHIEGGEVAAQLRRNAGLSEVPIVFLTAIASEFEEAEGGFFGGYPVLAKPVSRERLIAAIHRHARGGGAAPALA